MASTGYSAEKGFKGQLSLTMNLPKSMSWELYILTRDLPYCRLPLIHRVGYSNTYHLLTDTIRISAGLTEEDRWKKSMLSGT